MPTATTFRPDDLERLRADEPGTRVIDVRTPGEFAAGHITGAYNVPLPDLPEHRAELGGPEGDPIVLVCRSGRRAAQAEALLHEHGLDRLHVLDGGVEAWAAAGLPLRHLDPGAAPWPLERQVRLVAGGLVATAITASVRWPAARYAAGAVGLGLVVAAATDTCAMGRALARLPYNRRAASCDLPLVVSALTEPSEAHS